MSSLQDAAVDEMFIRLQEAGLVKIERRDWSGEWT